MRHALVLCACLALSAGVCRATDVSIDTSVGTIDVTLFDSIAPLNVANFLSYYDAGLYEGTFIHRSVPGFIIQGGGYTFDGISGQHIPTFPPVINESSPAANNLRGTLAMAHSADPDSATSEWFFNLANNPVLDGQFTVIGAINSPAGLAVMDLIAALPRINAGPGFENLPVKDYTGGPVTSDNLVTVVPEPAAALWALAVALPLLRRR